MLQLSPSADQLPAAPAPDFERGHSLWQNAWLRLRKNRPAVGGGAFILFLTIAALLLPSVLGLYYEVQGLYVNNLPPGSRVVCVFDAQKMARPSDYTTFESLADDDRIGTGAGAAEAIARIQAGERVTFNGKVYVPRRFWLGSDYLGRDLLARMCFGCRVSLGVGLAATFVSLTIGVIYGAVSGYVGGKTDNVMMRIVDVIYSLPFTIFVILLTVYFGRDIYLLFVAIGAVEWLTMARIVRGQVLSLKRMEFIEAARALGLGNRRIIFRHMIPNVLGPIIVYTTLTIPAVMLLEAFLSFLGLGVQPPMSSLGVMIKDGAERMEEYPWQLIIPAAAFSMTLFSLNFLGDGLRDALDVRASKD